MYCKNLNFSTESIDMGYIVYTILYFYHPFFPFSNPNVKYILCTISVFVFLISFMILKSLFKNVKIHKSKDN